MIDIALAFNLIIFPVFAIKRIWSVRLTSLTLTKLPVFSFIFKVVIPFAPRLVSLYSSLEVNFPTPLLPTDNTYSPSLLTPVPTTYSLLH